MLSVLINMALSVKLVLNAVIKLAVYVYVTIRNIATATVVVVFSGIGGLLVKLIFPSPPLLCGQFRGRITIKFIHFSLTFCRRFFFRIQSGIGDIKHRDKASTNAKIKYFIGGYLFVVKYRIKSLSRKLARYPKRLFLKKERERYAVTVYELLDLGGIPGSVIGQNYRGLILRGRDG